MNTTGKFYDAVMKDGKPIISFQVDSDAGMTEIMKGDLLNIKVTKHRAKRSLTANAYLWVLIDKIAEKTIEPRSEIYRQALMEAGVMETLVVKKEIASEAVNLLTDITPNGTGSFAIEGATKGGWTELYYYIGSSKYDTKQMSRLIDYVVSECRPLGIDTMTPEEIERLKTAWQSQ